MELKYIQGCIKTLLRSLLIAPLMELKYAYIPFAGPALAAFNRTAYGIEILNKETYPPELNAF